MQDVKIIFGAISGAFGVALVLYSTRFEGHTRTNLAMHGYGTALIAMVLLSA
jgi:hypothetical protein